MLLAQRSELRRALVGQVQPHDAEAVGVRPALDEAGGGRAVDQADRAVVAEQQAVGDIADGRPAGIRVAADGQQELVLRRRQPDASAWLSLQRRKRRRPVRSSSRRR